MRKRFLLSVLVMAVAVTSLAFNASALNLAPRPMPVPVAFNCPGDWQKVFDKTWSNAVNGGGVRVGTELTEQKMINLLANGCSIKVVKDYSTTAGNISTRFINSFECSLNSYQNATNEFFCEAASNIEGQAPQQKTFTLGWVGGTSVYSGTEVDAAGEQITLKIYARK